MPSRKLGPYLSTKVPKVPNFLHTLFIIQIFIIPRLLSDDLDILDGRKNHNGNDPSYMYQPIINKAAAIG
jgi:hypothetical protein